jgi:streptogramin lyase
VSRASVAIAVAGLALFAAPARAADVTRVTLGSTIEDLVVGPDGGAWVEIYRPRGQAIGRALPGGGFRTSGSRYAATGSALGPDGQAWFKMGSRDYVRSDGAGGLTRVELPDGPALARPMATGPDGTLWNLTATGGRFAHVTPQGTASYTATRLPKCLDTDAEPLFMDVVRASDGAMWIFDVGCERVIRVTATEATVVPVANRLGSIAADAGGGIWFAPVDGAVVAGHVDAGGTVKRYLLADPGATDLAVAPDGSAWFTFGTCTLARVSPAGEVATVPAPVPAQRLGFDPVGGMWLASRTRLVHVVPGEPSGPCDDRAPSVRVTPARGKVSLKALRRGVRIAIGEPAAVEVSGYPFGDPDEDALRGAPVIKRVLTRAGSLRYRLPASVLHQIARRLATGHRPGLALYIKVSDAEGVENVVQVTLRAKR